MVSTNILQLLCLLSGYLTGVLSEEVNICRTDESIHTLRCMTGTIEIQEASYGRNKQQICEDPSVWFTACSINITQHVISSCENKTQCQVTSDSIRDTFVDSCESVTNKYINIKYKCSGSVSPTESPKKPLIPLGEEINVTICQIEKETLECVENQQIVINSVFWGRRDNSKCPSTAFSNEEMCPNDVKLGRKIKKYCDGNMYCPIIAVDEWLQSFKCKTVAKYFEIRYHCAVPGDITTPKPTMSPPPNLKTKLVCSPLESIIFGGCQNGNVIRVLRATFGRQDQKTCLDNPTGDTKTYCQTDVTNLLRFQCDNSNMCFRVGTNAAKYGDPCPKVHKYLTVQYYCGKPVPTEKPPVIPSVGTLPFLSTSKPAQCGRPSIQSARIIQGELAKEGAWPWMVSIYSLDGDFICGGTLLSPLWVVTAAHCLRNGVDSKIYVVLGDTNRSKISGHEVRFGIVKIFVNKYDKMTNDNDITMLQLDRPVMFTQYISPACLPVNNSRIEAGTACYLTGWGKSEYPQRYNPVDLRQSQLLITTTKDCVNKAATAPGVRDGSLVTDNMVCANSKDGTQQSGCHGDSGGPLVCQKNGAWYLYGIASWTSSSAYGSPWEFFKCKESDMYTVFTRVTNYIQWIQKFL